VGERLIFAGEKLVTIGTRLVIMGGRLILEKAVPHGALVGF
jgi:hypothetical protein